MTNTFLSPIPEQHARRGRSRNARPLPLPILPPFPDSSTRVEKTQIRSKKVKNTYGQNYASAAGDRDGVDEIESRHDEEFSRMIPTTHLVPNPGMREGMGRLDNKRNEGTGKYSDELIRSSIASWKESKSLRSDNAPPDIITTPSDELPFFERKRRERVSRVDDKCVEPERSNREKYQLERLKARANQRKQRPQSIVDESKIDLKHLRASRIKVVRGLYQAKTQDLSTSDSFTTKPSNDDLSSVRDLTTLSSYRGKCFDKMLYLLNDVAPLEETDVPFSVHEGTVATSVQVSVAELKLIKKNVQCTKQECADNVHAASVKFPEHIVDHTDTIASKFSDVTSPTIQDGFELDEVPHFPRTTELSPEQLPCLAEVNESSENLVGTKSVDDFGLNEANRINSSTCSSSDKTEKAEFIAESSFPLIDVSDADLKRKEDEETPNDEDHLDEEASIVEEVTSILCEREAEIQMEAKARATELLSSEMVPEKRVTFFLDPPETGPPNNQAVPQNNCCIMM